MVPRSKAGKAGACRDCRIMTSDQSPAEATRMRSPSASGGMPASPAPPCAPPRQLKHPNSSGSPHHDKPGTLSAQQCALGGAPLDNPMCCALEDSNLHGQQVMHNPSHACHRIAPGSWCSTVCSALASTPASHSSYMLLRKGTCSTIKRGFPHALNPNPTQNHLRQPARWRLRRRARSRPGASRRRS